MRLSPLALLLLIACSDQGAPKIDLTGTWIGDIPNGSVVVLRLSDANGTVTGDGTIGSRTVAAISGSVVNETYNFVATLTTGAGSVQFRAIVTGDSMIGPLNGAGFDGDIALLGR